MREAYQSFCWLAVITVLVLAGQLPCDAQQPSRAIRKAPAPSPATNIPSEELIRSAAAQKAKVEQEFGITPNMTPEQAQQKMQEWYRSQHKAVAEAGQKPIVFFGQVIDQDNKSVKGVLAHLIWTDTSAVGTSEKDTQTDAKGAFALTGVMGRILQVWLSKDGYYISKTNQINFDFASGFVPDPRNPVIFRLRKKGPGADLITSKAGVAPDLVVRVPKNGDPVRVDMLQRKAGETGQIEIQSWIETDPTTHRTKSWRLRLSIPGGGFAEHHDEFPFMAPEQGYQSVLEFPQPGEGFGISQKTYYVTFGQPRKYGRIQISASAHTGNIMLQYAINPDGSRYLEPK